MSASVILTRTSIFHFICLKCSSYHKMLIERICDIMMVSYLISAAYFDRSSQLISCALIRGRVMFIRSIDLTYWSRTMRSDRPPSIDNERDQTTSRLVYISLSAPWRCTHTHTHICTSCCTHTCVNFSTAPESTPLSGAARKRPDHYAPQQSQRCATTQVPRLFPPLFYLSASCQDTEEKVVTVQMLYVISARQWFHG